MRHLFPKSILGHINQIKMNINITAHVLIKKTPQKKPHKHKDRHKGNNKLIIYVKSGKTPNRGN